MRCYLVVEYQSDLSALRRALQEVDVEVVTPDRAFAASPAGSAGYWLPEVDFVLAVFPERSNWETPSALLLDIGVAIGRGTPVLLIAEPSRRVDASLAPLPLAPISLRNQSALTDRLARFISTLGGSNRPIGEDTPKVDHRLLDAVSRDLETLRAAPLMTAQTAHRFEEIGLRLLRAAGAEVEEGGRRGDVGYDAAGWVPGTETLFPDPLLFEFKLLRDAQLRAAAVSQLEAYLARHGASFGVLICFTASPVAVKWPNSRSSAVVAFEIADLVRQLRTQTLAAVLRNRRNAVVHGGPIG